MPETRSLQLILGPNLISLDLATSSGQLIKEEIINNLITDIYNLLNTKQARQLDFSDNYSFITDYGLPDLSRYSPYSQQDKEKVSRLIASCLANFEPRLKNVTVTSQESDSFIFKICATFDLKKEQIPLVLEAQIVGSSQKIILKQK